MHNGFKVRAFIIFGLCFWQWQVYALSAGVAKAIITNDTPRVMVNGETSVGTHTDIYTRVLVLDDGNKPFIIVANDLNCLDVATPILRERLQKEMNLPPERLIILATHNHNAPIQIVPDNFEYGRKLADIIYDTIQQAMNNKVSPVALHFGNTYGYFLRAMGNAPLDYEIQILKVLHDDKPLAVLFNHGTHPIQATGKKVDAGHPGYAVQYIEEAWPGVQAMYADACGGNQFAREPDDFGKKIIKARPRGEEALDAVRTEAAQAVGRQLAECVLKVDAEEYQDVTGPIISKMTRLSLPLGEPIPLEEAEALAKEHGGREVGLVPYPDPRRSHNWVRMLLHYYDNKLPFPKETGDMVCSDDTYLIHKTDTALFEKYDHAIHGTYPCEYNEVITAKIGPMYFVAIQGEVCAPLGLRIKDFFRHNTPIMLFGYMGEHNLYLPTREIVRLNLYQSTVIQNQYASPVPWAPEVEDEAVRGVIRAVQALE